MVQVGRGGTESNLGQKQDLEMIAPEGLRDEFEGGEFDEFEQDNVLLLSPFYSGEETDSDSDSDVPAWVTNPAETVRLICVLNSNCKVMRERDHIFMRRIAQQWLHNFDRAVEVDHGIRGLALQICQWEYFETTVLVLIGINCIMLALYDPLDEGQKSSLAQSTQIVEKVLVVVFALEIVIKMVAFGLLKGRKAFFRSGWNWMDLLVVAAGLPSLVTPSSFSEKFTVIRALRVLRPLRTITRVPGLVVLVDTLIQCFSGMLPVIVIFSGFFFLFGVAGCQMFQGRLNYDCYDAETLLLNEAYGRKCGSVDCPGGNVCLVSQLAPNSGITSFNNIGVAFLTIFVAMTLEGWVDVMYMLQDSTSTVAATTFFLLLVLVGSFFVLQLTMAIVSNQYEMISNESDRQTIMNQAALSEQGSLSHLCPALPGSSGLPGCLLRNCLVCCLIY